MNAVGHLKTWVVSNRTLLLDTLLAVLLVGMAIGLIGATNQDDVPGLLLPTSPAALAGWTLPALIPLALRRIKPEPAAWMFIALTVIHLIFGPATAYSDFYAPLMLYSVLVYGAYNHTVRFITTAMAMCVFATLIWSWATRLDGSILSFALVSGVCVLSVVIMAFWQRARRATVKALQERNTLIAARAQDERRIAAEAERARIARDMHDVVAHTLSTIIVQSDGGRYAGAQDLDVAQRTMATIRAEAQHAQHDMASLFDIFANSDNAGYAGLDTLIRHAQLPVTRHVNGVARPELLSGQTSEALFRLVQESLSNARKYAGVGANVIIIEIWSPGTLSISVSDDGQGARACRDGHAPGYGLIGMRERVEAAGGAVSAGPQVAGGFIVQASLPLANVQQHSSDFVPKAFTAKLHEMASALRSKPFAQDNASKVNWIATLSLWCERHYLLMDMLIALALMILLNSTTLSEMLMSGQFLDDGMTRLIATLVTVAFLLPMAFRRRLPETSALTLAVLSLLQSLFFPAPLLTVNFFVLISVYSAVMYGRDKAWCWVSVALVINSWIAGMRVMAGYNGVASLYRVLFVDSTGFNVPALLLAGMLPSAIIMISCFGCVALARWTRSQGSNALVLQQREEALRAEEERQKVLAANLERNRIAAAMQEDVTATLGTVIEQADNGLALLGGTARPVPTAEDIAGAFASIGEQGRRALAHMRQLLAVLRETGFSDDRHDDVQMRLTPAARLHEQMESGGFQGMSNNDGNISSLR